MPCYPLKVSQVAIKPLHEHSTYRSQQGQGASQSIEDAESLAAFFSATTSKPTLPEISQALADVFEARYQRASLIQAYSRQQARPATEKGSVKVTLNPAEFLDYNCKYEGAVKWLEQQRRQKV